MLYLSPSEYSPRFGGDTYTVSISPSASPPASTQWPASHTLPSYKQPLSQTMSSLLGRPYPLKAYAFALSRPGQPPLTTARRFSELLHLWRHLNRRFCGGANDGRLYELLERERGIREGLGYDSDDEAASSAAPKGREVGCFNRSGGGGAEETLPLIAALADALLSGKFARDSTKNLSPLIAEDPMTRAFFCLPPAP